MNYKNVSTLNSVPATLRGVPTGVPTGVTVRMLLFLGLSLAGLGIQRLDLVYKAC